MRQQQRIIEYGRQSTRTHAEYVSEQSPRYARSTFTVDILLKLITFTPNHAEQNYVVESEIVESITRLLNNTQDLTLLKDILRLLMTMIDQT